MKTFLSFILKETKHILRDRRTVLVLFGMPVVMMLLFGFAISTDIRNVRTVAVLSSWDGQAQRIINRLDASEYFDLTATVHSTAEAERLIRSQKADMAVVFSPRFASQRLHGEAVIQLVLDGADPNTAVQVANYARGTIAASATQTPLTVSTKMLYNPQMKSSFNFVPGIMGMLLMLICAMMTSISIVREKEKGTMVVLLVSPVKPVVVIAAKAVPYLALAFIILVCILLLSVFVLGVPLRGSLLPIFGLSTLYILLALSLGLLISVVVNTQLVALLASAMMLLLPTIMLSGMIYPVESMPSVLRWLSCIVPARWYISAMRKLMIMGVSMRSVLTETTVLLCMTTVLLTLALKNFKYRLQ